VIEVPDGRVVALVRQSGRGRQSGVPIVVHCFELVTIRDGKIGTRTTRDGGPARVLPIGQRL
jgi:hypothetical protein